MSWTGSIFLWLFIVYTVYIIDESKAFVHSTNRQTLVSVL